MSTVVLSLGSNMGDKFQLLTDAINLIKERIGKIVLKSSIYTTEPWGFEADEDFANQMIVVETSYKAEEILQQVLEIEAILGRKRIETSQAYASRTMDIDILFIDDHVIDTNDLIVPHPRILDRRFVLLPLSEIIPEYIHPTAQMSIQNCLAMCKDTGEVTKL